MSDFCSPLCGSHYLFKQNQSALKPGNRHTLTQQPVVLCKDTAGLLKGAACVTEKRKHWSGLSVCGEKMKVGISVGCC